jgi:hypothetical protein
MFSVGNSERFWPSMPICWLLQSLCPESRMFSEPETFSAGPPGPSRFCTRAGSGEGSLNESPVVEAPRPEASGLTLMFRWEVSSHNRSKVRRPVSREKAESERAAPGPRGISPRRVDVLTVAESGSIVTRSERGSGFSFNPGGRSRRGRRVPRTNWSSNASREALFQTGGRESAGNALRLGFSPKWGSPMSNRRAGRAVSMRAT